MPDWITRYKPAASTRLQIGLAASTWTIVGSVLLVVGFFWTRHTGSWPILLPIAVVIGAIKARFVLAKSAQRIVVRIRGRGEGRCLGGFISWQMWLLAIGMMLLGRVLREGWLPRPVVGFIYEVIGVALLLAAIGLWRGLRPPPAPVAPPTHQTTKNRPATP